MNTDAERRSRHGVPVLECPTCDSKVSKTLAGFNPFGVALCPYCGERL